MFKIALLCGGPALERGISLNSARSVLDHLPSENIHITVIYFNQSKKSFIISPARLYSNTPADFDYKLSHIGQALSERALISLLRRIDIVFPVIHGAFGEDGTLQRFLEKNGIPFVGTGSQACQRVFDKYISNQLIGSLGFYTVPTEVLKIYQPNNANLASGFFEKHKLTRAVVKPANGASSIGVFSVNSVEEALEKARLIFSKRMDTRVVIQPFVSGREFTVIVLQNRHNLPVALIPTEIETDYTEHQIFDFRKKYLPTRHVTYHCPPRFASSTIEAIQVQAEQLFSSLQMRDFARLDGWVLENGKVWFSDFNPVSGMEQNSFLFQQSSRVGLSHRSVLLYILGRACQRYGIDPPDNSQNNSAGKKQVNVLFGGATSERQVSLMSGTNVWLKLKQSAKYSPRPFLLDAQNNIWQLPYSYTLNHTVEEIASGCETAGIDEERLRLFEQRAQLRLDIPETIPLEPTTLPQKFSLDSFLEQSSFVFNCLHGGAGENGTLQKQLADKSVKFNGSNESASRLCMDKWQTSQAIKSLRIEGVTTIPVVSLFLKDLQTAKSRRLKITWKNLLKGTGAKTLIVKPRADGCSTGIVHLYSSDDLIKYVNFYRAGATYIPKDSFKGQIDIVELPIFPPSDLLFERFIETDKIRIRGNKLQCVKHSGWIEITVGVLQNKDKLEALSPSLTVAEGQVLSVEEKFQGGTGVNLTPPPEEITSPALIEKAKRSIELLASKLNIRGYARIDAFIHRTSGVIMIIEINTLPGLTPSTIFFHQALAENPPVFPLQLLERIIETSNE